MQILGVGLSRTGTSSLHRALDILGLRSLHYDEVHLNDVINGTATNPDFRRYDNFDAVLDLPSAYFYEELIEAYPNCQCILTIRDTESWWRSISHHVNIRFPVAEPSRDQFRSDVRNLVYGSSVAREFLYKKRYREHNERVLSKIPSKQLLVMNITAGDGWNVLCPFLGRSMPSVPFPHDNRTPVSGADYMAQLRLATEEINELVPSQVPFILVDQGWWYSELGVRGQPVPFTEKNGQYWGPPLDDGTAIKEFERLRMRGAQFMVIGWPAFWWLDHYSSLNQHLSTRFERVMSNDRLIAYDLRR